MQVDLVGGYYDAGDNVKFGFPMAFTTTMLSWSVIEFGGLMKGELQHAKEAIKWGSDYLLKATAQPDTIYVQVQKLEKHLEIFDSADTIVKWDSDFLIRFRWEMPVRITLAGRGLRIWTLQEVCSRLIKTPLAQKLLLRQLLLLQLLH